MCLLVMFVCLWTLEEAITGFCAFIISSKAIKVLPVVFIVIIMLLFMGL